MNVTSALSGKSRQLGKKPAPDELVRESDVTDPPRLAKLLTRVLKALAGLERGFAPRRTDFEDVDVGTGTIHRFSHGFEGRVRWWVVDQVGSVPELVNLVDDTDAGTLVLFSGVATRVTIRVEEAG